MEELKEFEGLLFIKRIAPGTRSEGPGYFLQTCKNDLYLSYENRSSYNKDYTLEFYCRKMVKVKGRIYDDHIQVESIHETCERVIPQHYCVGGC